MPDYLVIGGGAVGLSTAIALLQTGSRTTVVERHLVGREASWAGGGILSPLCPWDYPEEVTRLAGRGAGLFSDWARELYETTGVDTEYEQSGMLVLPPCDAEQARQWCTGHDVLLQQVSVADCEVQTTGDVLLLPQVAQVRNPRLLHAMRNRVEMLGGHIVENCAVHEIQVTGERVSGLRTSCGKFGADAYVVTAGAWSREVLGSHALSLDLRPVRGQILLFKFAQRPLRHIVLQQDLYLIPRRDGHLLVGSTLEDVGFDKRTTMEAREELRRRAQILLPQLQDLPIVQHWAGLRPGSPHNIPTIGRHPHLENLYLNGGHFRYGVTMAPASAEILLNHMTGSPQPLDVTPYLAGWGN
jgi:glycine oxidase